MKVYDRISVNITDHILTSLQSGISDFYVESFRSIVSNIYLKTVDGEKLMISPNSIPLGRRFDADYFDIKNVDNISGARVDIPSSLKKIRKIDLISSIQLTSGPAPSNREIIWIDEDGSEKSSWTIPENTEQLCVTDCGLTFFSQDTNLTIVNNQGMPMTLTYYIGNTISNETLNYDYKSMEIWTR